MSEFSDDILREVIAGTASAEILQSVEKALELSSELRLRFERLSGLNQILESGIDLRQPLPHNSEKLQQAINSLKRDLPASQTADVVAGIDNALRKPDENVSDAGRSVITEGTMVDQIEVRQLLGKGAMGEVYEGFDHQLDRRVCLKVVSSRLVGSSSATERLLREAQAAAQLQHENIVSIYGIVYFEGSPILIQQFVPGESLSQRLSRDSILPQSDLLTLAVQLARGLSVAHRHGIIHRDLKPDNILLDQDAGIARVADFGLARRSGMSVLTQTGFIAGTPSYMSPEQTRGDELDGRSDLFSLGVVLYTAATGNNPFAGDNPVFVMERIRSFTPTPLQPIRTDLPRWFCQEVDRLLSTNREHRTSSAQELLGVLESERHQSISRNSLSGRDGLSGRVPAIRLSGMIAILALLVTVGGVIVLQRSGKGLDESAISEAANVASPIPGEMAPISDGAQSSADVNQLQQSVFRLTPSDRLFTSLAEAVSAAQDGNTIVVSDNGPFYCGTINVVARNLTIRAEKGYRPQFRPDATTRSTVNFLIGRDLSLYGLEILWPVEGTRTFSTEEIGRSAVICLLDGENTVSGCRIESGDRSVAIGVGNASLTVRNSRIDARGSCVGWFLFNTSVVMENCWLNGTSGISFSPVTGRLQTPGHASLAMNRCSINAQKLFNVFLIEPAVEPLAVHVEKSVFNVDEMVSISLMNRNPPRPQGGGIMEKVLPKLIQFRESHCIHRDGAAYVSGRRFSQPARVFQGAVKTRSDWHSCWGQEDSVSIAAGIVLNDPNDEFPDGYYEYRDTTGPVPDECGADLKIVGSRDAEHRQAE